MKDVRINYVVAFYFGHRKMSGVNNLLREDPYSIVRKHLEALNTFKIPSITKATFVISEYDDIIDRGVIPVVENYNSKIPIDIVFRKNLGYSYAAWNDVLNAGVDNQEDIDYYFLFEDDYIANQDFFYESYLNKMKNNVGYVCQCLGEFHSRLGNGIISFNTAREIKEKLGSVMCIPNNDGTYDGAINNQVHFTDNVIKAGYTVVGMEDLHMTVFQHKYGFEAEGNCNGDVVIAPVSQADWKTFTRDIKYGTFREHKNTAENINLILKKIRDRVVSSDAVLSEEETYQLFQKDAQDMWYLLSSDNSIIGYFVVKENTKDKKIAASAFVLSHFTGREYTSEVEGFKSWLKNKKNNYEIAIAKYTKSNYTYNII